MVGGEGLEPSYPCGHGILSPARLPVPPPALVGNETSAFVIVLKQNHFQPRLASPSSVL